MKFIIKLLVAIALVSMAVGVSASPTFATTKKVTLCHATHSNTNPFVKITVAYPSVTFQGHDQHQNNEDIIPPFAGYPGKNWTTTNQAIYNNGCNRPTTTTQRVTTTLKATTTTTAVVPTTTAKATTTTTAVVQTTVPQTTTTQKMSAPVTSVPLTGELARTGRDVTAFVWLGGALILGGLLALAARRRGQL